MRRILIEYARRRLAAKRGAGVEVVDLDGLEISSPLADDDQLLAVNEALEKFSAVDERKAELVKLRYFVGQNFEEAAAALGIAAPTAKQWWAYSRSWLTVEMRGAVAVTFPKIFHTSCPANAHVGLMSDPKPDMLSPQNREEALFQAAVRLTGAERAAFLNGACLGDTALRQRLEALLAAHDQPDNLVPTQAEARPAHDQTRSR